MKARFVILWAALAAVPAVMAEPTMQAVPGVPDGNKLDLRKGLQVYKSGCAECHATGKEGAPRLHDKAAWQGRSFQSLAVMQDHAKNGFLKMPPKGGHILLDNQDLANAVYYMSREIEQKMEEE